MSRARNIKPGFFKNDLLVELPFEVRLLFIGLWTEADRAGRLEDRPLKIRMAVFPADNVDVNAGLQALHDAGFIHRYQAGEIKCIQILAWDKHQNPHCKEAESVLPAPVPHGASTVQASEIPERAGLIPDSLIPDSLDKNEASIHTPPSAAGSESNADRVGRFEGHDGIPDITPNPVARFAIALNAAGHRCTPLNPDAVAYAAEGGTVEHLVACAGLPECAGKPATYVLRLARRELAEKARPVITGPPRIVPAAPLGKTAQAISALEEMKRGLAQNRTADRVPEIALLGSGSHPGG